MLARPKTEFGGPFGDRNSTLSLLKKNEMFNTSFHAADENAYGMPGGKTSKLFYGPNLKPFIPVVNEYDMKLWIDLGSVTGPKTK